MVPPEDIMTREDYARKEIRDLLDGGNAHRGFDDIVHDFPEKLQGRRPEGLPYSAWELLEHMRIAQNDILEFIRDPDYESPSWPEGYWPKEPSPPSDKAWDKSVKAFIADRRAIMEMVDDPQNKLGEAIPHGNGQTLMHEALLASDHTAYHLGQMVVIRRLLNDWKEL
jgi:hypothetical protein